jgi:hypothetical protein
LVFFVDNSMYSGILVAIPRADLHIAGEVFAGLVRERLARPR